MSSFRTGGGREVSNSSAKRCNENRANMKRIDEGRPQLPTLSCCFRFEYACKSRFYHLIIHRRSKSCINFLIQLTKKIRLPVICIVVNYKKTMRERQREQNFKIRKKPTKGTHNAFSLLYVDYSMELFQLFEY